MSQSQTSHSVGNQKWYVLASVACGTFMATLDSSIVNIALPTLTKVFSTDLHQTRWVVMAYLLVITGLLIPFGRLSDHYGRKPIFQMGFLVFTLGSAFCGLANELTGLVMFRVIQGIGAAMLMVNGPAIITTTFHTKERGRALGLLAMVVSAGLVAGPSLGGLLIGYSGWRSIFLLNIPIGFLGIFLVHTCVKANRPVGTHSALFDSSLLKNRVFWTSNLAGFLIFMAFSSVTVLMPFFLEDVLSLEPQEAGTLMTVIPLTVFIVAPLSGYLSDRFGTVGLSFCGALTGCLGLFLMGGLLGGIGLHEETNLSHVVLELGVIGVATGLFQSPNNSAMMGSVPLHKLGIASAVLAIIRNMGLVAGTGLATTLFAWERKTTLDVVSALHTTLVISGVIALGATGVIFARNWEKQ